MSVALFLTADERKKFNALPEALRSSLTGSIEDESPEIQESAEVVSARAEAIRSSLSSTDALALKGIFDRLQQEGIDTLAQDTIPPHLFQKVLLVIGVSGLSVFLEAAIAEAKDGNDLLVAADISDIRHQLIMTNSLLASV